MDAALKNLRETSDKEFLSLTRTALRIIQNILSEPEKEKYRTVRSASKYACKPGVGDLLKAVGFQLQGEDYVLDSSEVDTLLAKKSAIIAARKATRSVLGWDVPSSCVKFSSVLGKGKFGDVFLGQMDQRAVMVKVLQPDCGQEGKRAFDRELDILSKLEHPNVVHLHAVTLTSEPTALIMEHIPQCLLNVLHRSELSELSVISYSKQIATAMVYLHEQNVLHCDLAARNIMLASDGCLKLTEFSTARWDGTLFCRIPAEAKFPLNVRWTAPEVCKDLFLTKHADVWSYGVLLYEMVTGGSVPYATLSNSEVKAKIAEGYRLPQPHGCSEELYSLMRRCWSQRATDRPHFKDVLKSYLDPLRTKLSSGADSKGQTAASVSGEDSCDSKSHSSKPNKKSKIKELSYQAVAGKGGGLVRVYTALVSPLEYQVVVVCGKKTSVAEVVSTALAKCGKHELDAKCHRLAVVSSHMTGSPARYLDADDRMLSVKAGAPPTSMFVLCVHMPGESLLEVISTVGQNPAYGTAFSAQTHGYLVLKKGGEGQRNWCVLDGSTLLCYKEEEDEGVKQFENYLDFKGCVVTPTGNKKGHLFKVDTTDNKSYCFAATDKDNCLRWIEAIDSSRMLDPSPMLLHTNEGAVIQAGLMDCQEFANESNGIGISPLQPMVHRKFGTNADFAGMYTAVDYGKHWTVLRSSGLIQCLVEGKPETLFSLVDCRKVKVSNPKEMKEGVEDYSIEMETTESKFVLRAELPTDHFDWVLSIEQTLKQLDHEKLLQGHRKRESGYVALKRLLLFPGQNGGSQLYCFPRAFDDMEDIYDPPKIALPQKRGKRSELLRPASIDEQSDNVIPLPPKDYLPPPLPPRNDAPPPLPPKAKTQTSLPNGYDRLGSIDSSVSGGPDDDYVMMQSPSGGHSDRTLHMSSSLGRSPSQPITIPNRRSSKRSALLRTDSESSSMISSPPPSGSSLSDIHGGYDPSQRSRGCSVSSSTHSLNRQNSFQSLNSSFTQQMLSNCSLNSTPPLPPRVGERSSGYSSPLLDMSPSPGLRRSQSNRFNGSRRLIMTPEAVDPRFPSGGRHGESSKSDGMMVLEAQHHFQMGQKGHPVSVAGSIVSHSRSFESDGYGSSHSSAEELLSLPPGWERGYCTKTSRYFYFNSRTGVSTWNIQELLVLCGQQIVEETKPGAGWEVVRMENGRVYYYHQKTRQTTWNVSDTWA